MKAEIHRDGHVYMQEYECGKPMYTVKEMGKSDKTGTYVTFKPDDSIFQVLEYKFDTLRTRLKELSYLNKGVKLSLKDLREHENGNGPRFEEYYSEGGLSEFVQFIDKTRDSLIPEPIYFEGEKNGVPIDIAFQYNTSYNENLHSYVNNINTIEGGTHISGFRRSLTRSFKNYAEKEGLLKNVKFEISGDDFREGLTAVLSVKIAEPQFEGQTKTKLGNSEAMGAVDSFVTEALNAYLDEHPKEGRLIVNKVVLSAQARHAARKAREMVQRKSGFNSAGLPGKLADCSSSDPSICELYLVEGDSAGGTAKQGRNRQFQAILPLRGKILNVEKALEHKIYDNEEIKNLFTALGVHIGTEEDDKALNMDKLRYHKVIIMTDADVDGSHITTLILTLLYRYMKKLIESGYVYIATPPLYLVKKGSQEQYCWNDDERDLAIQRMKGEGKESSVNIQRYKGLGEMNAEQLWKTTMDPDRRTLRLVNIENAAESDRIFSMLMGDEVAPRREFIEQNARYANIDV